MGWRTRDMFAILGTCAAVVTIAVAFDPSTPFAFRSPELRTALETAQALIATLGAYLFYGRVRRRHLLNDLAVVFALGLLGASNLFYAALPVTGLSDPLIFPAWSPLVLRLLAGAVMAWAALARDRPLPPSTRHPGVAVVVAADVVLAIVAIAVAGLQRFLPVGVEAVNAITGAVPELSGHPALRAGYLAIALLWAATALGFLRRAEGRRDPLIAALSIASLLEAFAFLCFAIYPSINTEIVQGGDALRLAFYLILLFGGEREIDRYWTRLADVAVLDERRRLARDLHDGLAQELAFVVTQTRLLLRGTAAPGTEHMVAAAAERALDESRRAIIALSTRVDEPLHLALARAAEDVAGRVGVQVEVDVDVAIEVTPEAREDLVRIVQEAVGNAGRHGNAQHVLIKLTGDRVLQVTDDGSGFDPDNAGLGRFGLVSMRERAERMGGRFQVTSEPGWGTTVEVTLR